MTFLYDSDGGRKYLTSDERARFLVAAKEARPEVFTFCATLAYTGARISEVLQLSAEKVDTDQQLVLIECLKKRQRGIFRAVPVPSSLLELLDQVHFIQRQRATSEGQGYLWSWSRTTGWKYVTQAMQSAGISGVNATPKALRHAFAITALHNNVPITTVQKWMGHSRLTTTAIYANATGPEEREFAERVWRSFQNIGHYTVCKPIVDS